jgi:hypothetical protein
MGESSGYCSFTYFCSSDISHEFGKIMQRSPGTDTGVMVLFSNEKVCLTSHEEGKMLWHKTSDKYAGKRAFVMGTQLLIGNWVSLVSLYKKKKKKKKKKID